jgi:hypothetical protein
MVKRFLLILILVFPVLTLLFWVYRGDAIRPRKPSGVTNQIQQMAPTNQTAGSNSSGSTNTNEPSRAR